MLESSFALLREIGILTINSQEEVHFSIDAYHGYRYASVRRYLKLENGFSSPTRDGVTLTPEIVRALVPMLQGLPNDAKRVQLGTIGKFAKRPGICIVVKITAFHAERGLDLRQWSQEKGFGQNGIWLPLTHWTNIRKLFADTLAALDEVPDVEF